MPERILVGRNDTVEVRYPTPSTWNTLIRVDVRIGSSDIDQIVFGTRIPLSKVPEFDSLLKYQRGRTSPGASSYVFIFERNTNYYSDIIPISGLEIKVPVILTAETDGPKGLSANVDNCGFSINGQSFINIPNSKVTFTANTTKDSKVLTNVNYTNGYSASDLAVGMYISGSPAIGGEITAISGNTITVTNLANQTVSGSNYTAYKTVQSGDTVQLKIKTEDWYTSSTRLNLQISDEIWGDDIDEDITTTSGTWSITTRPQKLAIPQFRFTDFIDVLYDDFDDYKTSDIEITPLSGTDPNGVDLDCVLRGTVTVNGEISKDDGSTWKNPSNDPLTNIFAGDNVKLRTKIGADYTTRTNTEVTIFSVAGETATGGRENNINGTWGYEDPNPLKVDADNVRDNSYQTQVQGSVNDDQYLWTEVDRYPDPISLSPIYIESDGDEVVVSSENEYRFANPSVPQELGYETESTADGQFIYRANFNISGLGVEYADGAYDPVNTDGLYVSATNDTLVTNPFPGVDTSLVDGGDVEIEAVVVQGAARIRRQRPDGGNAYTYTDWSDRQWVKNGDIINVKYRSSEDYNTTLTSIVNLNGPPDGPEVGNPTQGPKDSLKSFPDKQDSITIKTRQARKSSFPFKLTNIYNAEPLDTYEDGVSIGGFDLTTTGQVTSTNNSAQIKAGGSYQALTAILPPATVNGTTPIDVKINSTSGYGVNAYVATNVIIGQGDDTYTDQWLVFNKLGPDWTYRTYSGGDDYIEDQIPQYASKIYFVLVGAGGGHGGDDAPNSFGGRGGIGNVVRGYVELPEEFLFGDFGTRTIRVYTGQQGGDGTSAQVGAAGGAGGWGYADGGNGGTAGSGDSDTSGGGGGGGGATALTFVYDANDDGTAEEILLAFAGGGAGGGGAGNDTTVQLPSQNAHWDPVDEDNEAFGTLENVLTGFSGGGRNGANNPGQGGGAGGAGGGFGTGGSIITERLDEYDVVVQTDDLDATGGTGGGAYYNGDYATIDFTDIYHYGNFGSDASQNGRIVLYWPPQDKTPIFVGTFETALVDPLTSVQSNVIQVTDITGLVEVNVFNRGTSNAQFYKCDDINKTNAVAQGSSGFVANNQFIFLEATTGSAYEATYVVEITIGTATIGWTINTTEKPDRKPDNDYDIPDVTGEDPSLPLGSSFGDADYVPNRITSDPVIITGVNAPCRITATAVTTYDVKIAVCDDTTLATCSAFENPVDNEIFIENDEYFRVQMDAPTQYSSSSQTNIVVGDDTGGKYWNIFTVPPPDLDPDDFAFLPVFDAEPGTTVKSPNTVRIRGISEPVTFLVNDTASSDEDYIDIELNGVLQGTNEVTVNDRDTIRLYYTLPDDAIGETWDFSVTAGDAATTWLVEASGNAATTPTGFTFANQEGAPGTFVESVETVVDGVATTDVLISGLSTGLSVGVYLTNGGRAAIADSKAGLDSASFTTYTESSKGTIQNGKWLRLQLQSSLIPGISKSTKLFVGSYSTTFTVFATAAVQDPVKGQWYSSIQPMIFNATGDIIGRFATKFDGLPVGSVMPVFKDTTEDYNWGDLDGNINSRFHGWIYCDGRYVEPSDYPLLYNLFSNDGNSTAWYGEDAGTGQFRLPDFRNRKVLGTGVVDSSSSSSPIVNPTYNPKKGTGGNIGGTVPGCQGGMWFIDTIGDPGYDGITNTELEQVYTPAAGQKAQESPYFAIANITTQGYQNVTGQIEFEALGTVTAPISIKKQRIYDVPLHSHILVTGQKDPAQVKGRIYWNRRGGINQGKLNNKWLSSYPTNPSGTGSDYSATRSKTAVINLWGFGYLPVVSDWDATIGTPNLSQVDDKWDGKAAWVWRYREHPGDPGAWNNAWNEGEYVEEGSDSFETVTIDFDLSSGDKNEINKYINQSALSVTDTLYVTTVDIPEREVSVKGFRPAETSQHTHYLSLTQPGDLTTNYSYGHGSLPGTAKSGVPDQLEVNLSFSALETGLSILPGTFVLSQNKQLIPVPELSPQDTVPLISPYTWVKWLIKAF